MEEKNDKFCLYLIIYSLVVIFFFLFLSKVV